MVAKKTGARKSTATRKNTATKKVAASKKKDTSNKKSTTKKKTTSKELWVREAQRAFPVAGIGASAGGLEAIEGLLSKMPSDSGVAFVIIQHLAPKHKSIMDTLLQKYTDMKIMQIKDGIKVKPNHIYLNPPDKDVGILNGMFYLIDPDQAHALRMPIDFFFRSLAQDQGEKAVCIILSGSGTDGTLGMKAIKGEGGLTMCQAEEQAKYDSMPRSAISTGMVDFILPVEKMSEELLKYVKHPYVDSTKPPVSTKQKRIDTLQRIFLIIRSRTGHDFSKYKQNTIRRRIERRMAVHQIERLDDYVKHLQQDPMEAETLAKDLLIGVTNFFRDPEAFEAFKEKVLLPFMKKKAPETSLRIWVPGCSTGEEAYSIAIIVKECMANLDKTFTVQIFGTDLDIDSIEYARAGSYPESIAANISPERLQKYFVKTETTYKVRKQIREMVVFAGQNLIKDPPFSRLDVVSCRNLMIYLDQQLQKKILPLFHYTLNDDGILFLGTSESIGEFSDLFSAVDSKWKIFRRKPVSGKPEYPDMHYHQAPLEVDRTPVSKPTSALNVRQLAEDVILTDYAPPCVLVNEKLEIVFFHGKTDMFLSPPTGEPSFNILKMAREEIRYRLSIVLHRALKQKKTIVSRGVKVKSNGTETTLDLVVRPLKNQRLEENVLLVVFELSPPAGRPSKKEKARTPREEADPRIINLEQELSSTREYLQTTIEELETSNEELQSNNEEMQSTNEEMQSTNEELETAREELQSTNEELETVNSELQNKVNELSRVNDDLNNLLASTEIGTIFLDTDFCIKGFTPSVANLFNLIDTDIGRPISDITSKLLYEDISKDARDVLETLKNKEMDLKTSTGEWYSMRMLPYRTVDNVIDGVVIAFFDITAIKRASEYAEGIVNTVREPLVVMDKTLRVISANRSFYETFNVEEINTRGRLIYELGNRQWDIPSLRELLENILKERSEFTDYLVEHNFPDIGRKTMLLNARRIFRGDKNAEQILLAIEDVTGRTEIAKLKKEASTKISALKKAGRKKTAKKRIKKR